MENLLMDNKVQIAIGVSDFRKIIESRGPTGEPYLYVDKSLFIKDILDDGLSVKLITRPRRFGKTLNMSMLQYFFAKEIDNKPTANLFENLKIAQYPQYMKYQGQYPVIFLTFKDIKSNSFDAAYANFIEVVRGAYLQFEKEILASPNIRDWDKRDFELFLERKASDSAKINALKNLTYYLSRCYEINPIVLIDEYDTPIHTARSSNKIYYDAMITFMREFLGAALKDNAYLEKAIITGILRISKESLFSGLNNIKVYSLLNSHYGDYFGFTEGEVKELLKISNLNDSLNKVKNWYNGYNCGDSVVYNPWSIINFLHGKGKVSAYWVNTADNTLIKELLIQSSLNFKKQFELLLQDIPIEMHIDEYIVFNSLDKNEHAVWTLLLMAGYLKAKVISEEDEDLEPLCRLQIPNKEVKSLYQRFIAEWLSGINNPNVFHSFINDLLNGNMDDFERSMRMIMLQTLSVHDVKGKNSEKFFYGFMLGLVAGINQAAYQIESNKESGYGRFDIALIPRDSSKLGIIMEIKNIETKNAEEPDMEKLKRASEEALEQINKQQYQALLLQSQIKNMLKIGIAFSGKDLAVTFQEDRKHANNSAELCVLEHI